MQYSSSKENHIKAIFHLQESDGLVTTNELAAALQTKPASVTDMLKKLKQQKLLNYERYKGFASTVCGNVFYTINLSLVGMKCMKLPNNWSTSNQSY